MAKSAIVIRPILERVLKSYMTSGKEMRVLTEIFKLSGGLDSVLVTQGNGFDVNNIVMKV